MKKLRTLIALLITAGLAVAYTGCSDSSAQYDKNELQESSSVSENTSDGESGTSTISEKGLTVRVQQDSFWITAEKSGLLDEEFGDDNITFEYYNFTGGSYVSEAIATGSLDFGSMGEQPSLTAIAAGYPLHIIGAEGYSDKYLILVANKDSGITNVEDLAGKSVGTLFGGSLQYATYKYLESAGLTDSDIELLNVSMDDAASLLRTGDLDAGVVNATVAETLINEGTAVKVADGTDFSIDTVTVFVGGDEFIKNHPDITARIIKVLDKAVEYANENTSEAMQWVADELQQDYGALLTSYDNFDYDFTISQRNINTIYSVEQFLLDKEMIKEHIKLEDAIDLQYLEAAGIPTDELELPE